MQALKIVFAVVFALLVAVALIAPIGPLPGIIIGGSEMQAPAEWPDTSDVHEISLEVPGILPRVVTIWMIGYGPDIYVTGYRTSGWVKMLGNGGPVRMRLGDKSYSLVAQAVTEDALPVLQAYMDKYRTDYPDIVANFPAPESSTYALFRLARPEGASEF